MTKSLPYKKGDKIEVIPLYKPYPIFVGRVTRFSSDKKFVYVFGRFDSTHFPFIKSRQNAEEIGVSIENTRPVAKL